MKKLIVILCGVIWASEAVAVTQIIPAGEDVTGGDVHTVVTQQVYGTTRNFTVSGNQQIMSGGKSYNSVIYPYGQQIESGGVASGALVRTGGVQSVFSGGKAENTVVERNGWLFLFAGGILSGKTSVTEGVVTFVGSNSIPDMEMRNAVAIVPYSHDFSSLQFDNLSGQGTFGISSSLSEGLSDKILVHSGSGNFGLVIHDYSPEGSTPARYKIIDEDSGAADSFYLVGDAVDVGAFRYGLERDGDDWVLVRTQDVTDSAVIAKNTYSSLASLFYTHLTPVYNHIRSRRNASGHDNGLWVKGLGQRVKFAYKDKSRSRIDIYGTEIGYDREVWRQNGHYLSMGVYGGYTSSRQKFDRSGHGDADTQSLGLYSLFNTDDNWFVDMVGTYFWHRQKLRSYTPAGSGVDGKYRTNSWQLSASLGKRVNFDGRWFVEPSVGLNYMHIDAVRYRTNFNTLIEASDAGYLSTRADLIAGKSFVWGDNRFLDAYGRFALIHDIDGKSKVRVADYGFAEDLSSLRYELGAGVSTAWSEDGTAYLETSAQLGSRIKLPWEINFGIQYRF